MLFESPHKSSKNAIFTQYMQRITIWCQFDKMIFGFRLIRMKILLGYWILHPNLVLMDFIGSIPIKSFEDISKKKIERLLSWMWEKFCFCFFSDSSLKRVPFGRMGRHFDGLMKCFSQNIHLGFVINWRPCPSVNTQRKRYFFSVQKSNPLF